MAPGVQAGSGSTWSPEPRAVQWAGRLARSAGPVAGGAAVPPPGDAGSGPTRVPPEQAQRASVSSAARVDRVIGSPLQGPWGLFGIVGDGWGGVHARPGGLRLLSILSP